MMNKQGRIIKGIAGFYYVHVVEAGTYECKAKGIFRKQDRKPHVGDEVLIQVIDEEEKKGNIEEIFPRKNVLIRPAVANIDQAVIIFAMKKPKPNLNLLDRFLIMMERQDVKTVICFNKSDLASQEELEMVQEIYINCGYQVLFISVEKQKNIEKVKEMLSHKTSTVAGPSGVGKSSLINLLQSGIEMETNEISRKIDRGKHTTRHSQLIYLKENTYIVDTPGFSSLRITDCDAEDLKYYFIEFEKYRGECRFPECSHTHEPDCKVKEALELGEISRVRYDNYVELYQELKNQRRY
jgi:ribosome biogenesis GTPase